MPDSKDFDKNLEANFRGRDGTLHSVITYQLKGHYSYERETDPEVVYKRYIGYQDVDEWLEHASQLVTPRTWVRLKLEVME